MYKTHNMSSTRFYGIYASAKKRCEKKYSRDFPKYGGRGIRFMWTNFESFKNDMYQSYLDHCNIYGQENTTLDRLKNIGNYSKQNCRWATRKVQARNRSSNKLVNGKTLPEWAEISGIKIDTLKNRHKRGWSFTRMINTK